MPSQKAENWLQMPQHSVDLKLVAFVASAAKPSEGGLEVVALSKLAEQHLAVVPLDEHPRHFD